MKRILLLIGCIGAPIFAQAPAAPIGLQAEVQYLDNYGRPLAGAKLCTYIANTSIALATYTDATGGTPNTNPVILDSAGRASIWGTTSGQLYQLILRQGGDSTCLTGTILWSQNNVPVMNAGGSSSQLNALYVIQTSSGASGAGGYIDLPQITYPNESCLDIYGNPVNQPIPPSGANAFGANDVVMWNSPSPLAGASPPGCATAFTVQTYTGLNLNTYLLAMGGLATTDAQYNSIQSLTGGMWAQSFSAVNYMNMGSHAGIPPLTSGDGFNPGAIYYDTLLSIPRFWNGAAWISFGTGGGGGGGSAAPPLNSVQFNSPLGVFAGSSNFTFNQATQLLTVTALSSSVAGIAVGTGYIQSDAGFLATSGVANTYNSFNSPTGGMAAKSFTASNYIQSGSHSGAPPVTTSDTFHAGALYWDTGSAAEQVYNGSAWVSLGGGSGTPGGSTTNVQFNSSGAFAGSGNFTWSNSGQLLTVTAASSGVAGIAVGTGYVQSDAGFYATSGTATNWNAISAPGGGMGAKSFTAGNYIQSGSGSAAPSVTTGDTFHAGALFYNTTSGAEQVYNGSSWISLATGGAPGGSTYSIQSNQSGFYGDSNLLWTNGPCGGSYCMVVTSPASRAAIVAVGGYIQADAGVFVPSGSGTNFNVVQAPGGGMAAKSFTAINYIQTGNSNGVPTVTSSDSFHAGALYWDTGLAAEQVYNGTSWASLGGGGGGGITSLNGLTSAALAISGGSYITVSPAGSTITVSIPQSVATTANPLFNTLQTTSTIQSDSTGSAVAFENIGGTFVVTGAGALAANSLNVGSSNFVVNSSGAVTAQGVVSTPSGVNVTTSNAYNNVQTTGGFYASGASNSGYTFTVGATGVINNSGAFVSSAGINTSGGGTFGTAITANGGIATGSATNSTIYIGTGSLYMRYPGASSGISCSGVANGWAAITSDDYLVVCAGTGSRYRAALSSY